MTIKLLFLVHSIMFLLILVLPDFIVGFLLIFYGFIIVYNFYKAMRKPYKDMSNLLKEKYKSEYDKLASLIPLTNQYVVKYNSETFFKLRQLKIEEIDNQIDKCNNGIKSALGNFFIMILVISIAIVLSNLDQL